MSRKLLGRFAAPYLAAPEYQLRLSHIKFATMPEASEGVSHSSLLSPLSSFVSCGRSGLRPSLVQGLRPRNAPLQNHASATLRRHTCSAALPTWRLPTKNAIRQPGWRRRFRAGHDRHCMWLSSYLRFNKADPLNRNRFIDHSPIHPQPQESQLRQFLLKTCHRSQQVLLLPHMQHSSRIGQFYPYTVGEP